MVDVALVAFDARLPARARIVLLGVLLILLTVWGLVPQVVTATWESKARPRSEGRSGPVSFSGLLVRFA
jgi:hypothetical protein